MLSLNPDAERQSLLVGSETTKGESLNGLCLRAPAGVHYASEKGRSPCFAAPVRSHSFDPVTRAPCSVHSRCEAFLRTMGRYVTHSRDTLEARPNLSKWSIRRVISFLSVSTT